MGGPPASKAACAAAPASPSATDAAACAAHNGASCSGSSRQQQQQQEQQQQPRFSRELWARVEGGVFRSILEHPFLLGMMAGSLPEACFRFYIAQDVLYLRWVQAGQGAGAGGARRGALPEGPGPCCWAPAGPHVRACPECSEQSALARAAGLD